MPLYATLTVDARHYATRCRYADVIDYLFSSILLRYISPPRAAAPLMLPRRYAAAMIFLTDACQRLTLLPRVTLRRLDIWQIQSALLMAQYDSAAESESVMEDERRAVLWQHYATRAARRVDERYATILFMMLSRQIARFQRCLR